MKSLKVLAILAILTIGSGCAWRQIPEPPLCKEPRPVLEDISREEQLTIRNQISEDLLRRVSENDKKLKESLAAYEKIIDAHDEPLAPCG